MPRSKRNKQVELAKTKKRGLEGKKHLYQEVRSCADNYAHIFVFTVTDMRNSKMKNVREQWKDSRFFIGKNKVMALALGRTLEDEYKPNLHKIGQRLKGERGLLFSNRSSEEVLSWFRSYSEGDFARSGNNATETVVLCEGALSEFPHSLEPYLRQLGLPTTLKKGIVHLVKDHEVCKVGDTLTPETARILKLLGYEMAEFHLKIECVWSQDGTFLDLSPESRNSELKENAEKSKVKKKKNSLLLKDSPPFEPMDISDSAEELNKHKSPLNHTKTTEKENLIDSTNHPGQNGVDSDMGTEKSDNPESESEALKKDAKQKKALEKKTVARRKSKAKANEIKEALEVYDDIENEVLSEDEDNIKSSENTEVGVKSKRINLRSKKLQNQNSKEEKVGDRIKPADLPTRVSHRTAAKKKAQEKTSVESNFVSEKQSVIRTRGAKRRVIDESSEKQNVTKKPVIVNKKSKA
ncbi:mRNA turnover protein 4-like protein, partial [Stegodyphus mimosarum]